MYRKKEYNFNNRNDRNKYKLRGIGKKYSNSESFADNYDYLSKLSYLIDDGDIKYSEDVKDTICDKFEDFDNKNIKENLLSGIFSFGFETPSRIQRHMINPMMKGKDILAQSQSGTGKTAAFMIPALQLIDDDLKKVQVLIISPTQELAYQTKKFGEEISKNMKNVKFSYSVGKTDRKKNANEILGTNGTEITQVVTGTPGRITDLVQSHGIGFESVKLIILDECDTLLSGNFKDKMFELLTTLINLKEDKKLQICLISATFRRDVYELSKKFLNEPCEILLQQEKLTLDGIKQRYVMTRDEYGKKNTLSTLLSIIQVPQLMIYVNTKDKCEELRNLLTREDDEEEDDGVFKYHKNDVKVSNGDLDNGERFEILKNFHDGNGKCLITTDLLARGINIQQLSLIINFELPSSNFDNYLHRIGRTGRYGKKGMSINIICGKEEEDIQESIKLAYKCEIEPLTKAELQEESNF